jgi:hypothetical protein
VALSFVRVPDEHDEKKECAATRTRMFRMRNGPASHRRRRCLVISLVWAPPPSTYGCS